MLHLFCEMTIIFQRSVIMYKAAIASPKQTNAWTIRAIHDYYFDNAQDSTSKSI